MKIQLSQKIIDDLADLGFKDTQGWTLAKAIDAMQEANADKIDLKFEKWYYKILVSFGGIVAGAAGLIIAILK